MKPWFLRGKVIHGFGRGGTQLGYPTANVELDEPAISFLKSYDNLVLWGWGCVEAAETGTEDASTEDASSKPLGPFPFVMSIGNNPQFRNVDISAEVHFLHKFSSDFYGRVVRIIAVESIRSQAAFTTLEELIQTIDNDVKYAREHLKMLEWAPYQHQQMINPAYVQEDVIGSGRLPSFGFLEQ
ncbi:hypothetical protein JKF63_01317 [Porcisia hertigi]|uniref:riboflavin kinase n=1 Tax=Porcisia hertigi TaxID=2761500 RepID=A0A836HUH2_9TRYP|nr:hypothetical protein JKF63_01317 [Porcisia hertigi]